MLSLLFLIVCFVLNKRQGDMHIICMTAVSGCLLAINNIIYAVIFSLYAVPIGKINCVYKH